jgi:hypothetical protein
MHSISIHFTPTHIYSLVVHFSFILAHSKETINPSSPLKPRGFVPYNPTSRPLLSQGPFGQRLCLLAEKENGCRGLRSGVLWSSHGTHIVPRCFTIFCQNENDMITVVLQKQCWNAGSHANHMQNYNISKTKFRGLSPQANYTTERPPLVGEVSANFCGERVSRVQRNGSPRPYSRFSRPKLLIFLPSSSSIVLMRLSGPRSRPTTSQKIW